MLKDSLLELIGQTPIVKYKTINNAEIYIKLEMFNLGGSIKDRPVLKMILEAEQSGQLKPNMTLVEATSGNTGIALALIGAIKKYPVKIFMPENMSKERISLMKAYGATIILTPQEEGMKGATKKAIKLAQHEDCFFPDQFNNKFNPQSHITTAQEILTDLPDVTHVVIGVGTSGTLSGVSKNLKKMKSDIQIIAVEPKSSPVLKGQVPGSHVIQGIGANFVPPLYDASDCNQIYDCSDQETIEMASKLAKEGYLLGLSSAANMCAAINLAKSSQEKMKIVVIAPDGGMKYLSQGVY